MRPGGAAIPPTAVPFWVWQLLQSPDGTAVAMLRVFPLKLTVAVMGNTGQPPPAGSSRSCPRC